MMTLLHSRLARESCAPKNKSLPLLCRGREFIVPGTRAGTAFPALYDTGPL